MSTAKQRAEALRKRDTPQPAAEQPDPAIRAKADPQKKVRQTVDLTHQRHVELAAWRMETALALGRTRITTQDVLRAAVDAILRDPTVARHVRAQLERDDDQ